MFQKLKEAFLWFFDWPYDRQFVSRNEKERKYALKASIEWIIFLAVSITALVLLRKYSFWGNIFDLIVFVFCVRFIVYLEMSYRAREEGVTKTSLNRTDRPEFENEYYEVENVRLRKYRFLELVFFVIAAVILVWYIIYAINLIRFGYFQWSILGVK